MIERPTYLTRLIQLAKADAIVVITGVRRCGKSTLLKLFMNHLLDQGIDQSQIIEINYESALFDELLDPEVLHQYVNKRISDTKYDHYYLLMDEVQELAQWARTLNSLRVSFPLTICVTGSNSRLFSGEGLTYISGRYVELKMYPLSFEEFLRFKSDSNPTPSGDPFSDSARQAFSQYLSEGAFPAVALANDPEVKSALLQGIVDSVIVRDVVARGRIENESLFRRVAQFLFDNIGSEIAAKRIADTLKSNGHKITVNTVERYIELLCSAFVLYRCPRYDIKGRKLLTTTPKYYVVDMGLRNAFLGERPRDYGHVLENLIYIELLRRGYEVSTGRINGREVDFIASANGEKAYIQVAQTLMIDSTEDREYKSLLMIDDAFPKYIMSLDDIDHSNRGIKHVRIQDFLRGEKLNKW